MPFLCRGVRLATPHPRSNACRPIKAAAGLPNRRIAHRLAPLRPGPMPISRLALCAAGGDYGNGSEEGGQEVGEDGDGAAEGVAELLMKPYSLGAVAVSVAVKAVEGAGTAADKASQLAQKELPRGAKSRKAGPSGNGRAADSSYAAAAEGSGDATAEPVASKAPPAPAKAKPRKKFESTLPGMIDPIRLGAKEWVGTWWPQALEASSQTERAVADSGASLGEWAYDLAESVGSGIETTTSDVIKIIGGSKDQLEVILKTKTPAKRRPGAVPREEKKVRFSFMQSVPIVKSFFGRKEGKKEAGKEEGEADVDATDGQAESTGYARALKSLVSTGKKDNLVSTAVETEPAKPEDGEKMAGNVAQVPILKSFFGEYGTGPSTEDVRGTARGVGSPAPELEAPKAKDVDSSQDSAVKSADIGTKTEPKAKKETPLKQMASTFRKEVLPTPATTTPPKPATVAPPKPAVIVGKKTESQGYGQQSSGTATAPAQKAPTGQVYEKLVKETVGSPVSLAKGPADKMTKVSGGALGGPYNLSPRKLSNASSREPSKTPQAATGGGGTRGGSYGGDGGYGGGGEGFPREGQDECPGDYSLVWFTLILIIILAGIWYLDSIDYACMPCTAPSARTEAKQQPTPKECAS
ncbi:unnamed protein product [Ostreobium quekettii]|uniref:Uncharacterized protein n=1 Tax=Ostreobium quekettii TaxID=121088 RepID=A0A8S1IRY4_9CHLO|nr:unnamed protein product [Ostreobium quekettii]|eukprot:evm.model.scf_472.9 EVM.evm.TU.scf_472.9   scf_472:78423-82650(+)